MKKIIKATRVNIGENAFKLYCAPRFRGHYLEILERLADQMNAMLSYHCKILVFRIDLRLNEYTCDNKPVTDFVNRLRKHLRAAGHKRVGYIWVREHDSSCKQHYHMTLIIDANRNQHPHNIIEKAKYYWENWGCGHLYVPTSCYRLVRRGDPDSLGRAFERNSYLAKVKTKARRPMATNDFSASRLKPKVQSCELLLPVIGRCA